MKDPKMTTLSIINFRKLLVSLTLIVFGTVSPAASAGETCKNPLSNNKFCSQKAEKLNSINNQFKNAFSGGGVVNISQPPLVIIPEIEINIPSILENDRKNNLRPKIAKRLKTKKNLDKNYFIKIVDALDTTGKKHLNQCISKISDNRLKDHYSDFLHEINTLKTITSIKQEKFNAIGLLISKSPSQKDCFKYLDFILMIG